MAGPLAGRVALVTGASSGIGEATARALAAAGATVVAAARRRDRLERLTAEIAAAGASAHPLQLDVTDETAVAVAVASVERRFGRLDVAVNSAGIMYSARLGEAKPGDLRAMLDANVLGTMLVSQAALRLMRSQGSGHIVTVASVSARYANPGSVGYASTKSAVVTFSEALRKDCIADGIRVTLVLPGLTQTEIFDHLEDPATRQRFAKMMEGIKILDASDVAGAIVYALTVPPHVSVSEIVIRPTQEPA